MSCFDSFILSKLKIKLILSLQQHEQLQVEQDNSKADNSKADNSKNGKIFHNDDNKRTKTISLTRCSQDHPKQCLPRHRVCQNPGHSQAEHF